MPSSYDGYMMWNVSEMSFYDILPILAMLLSNANYSLLKTVTTTWQFVCNVWAVGKLENSLAKSLTLIFEYSGCVCWIWRDPLKLNLPAYHNLSWK